MKDRVIIFIINKLKLVHPGSNPVEIPNLNHKSKSLNSPGSNTVGTTTNPKHKHCDMHSKGFTSQDAHKNFNYKPTI